MSVLEICLIVIALCMVVKTVSAVYLTITCMRTLRKQVMPILHKVDGALDNVSAVTHAAREQVDELRSVVDDVSYRARVVASDVHERVLPPIVDAIAAFSGIARMAVALFSLFRKR